MKLNLRQIDEKKRQKPLLYSRGNRLKDSLSHHGLGHFHKPSDVGALHVIDVTVRFRTVFHTVFVNITHYPFQFFVHLLGAPT